MNGKMGEDPPLSVFKITNILPHSRKSDFFTSVINCCSLKQLYGIFTLDSFKMLKRFIF